MPIDVTNQAVKLCQQGMEAEMKGLRDQALAFYMQAWDGRSDGFEGCIAAHYIAKFQQTPEEIYFWNKAAFDAASENHDERVNELLPSLLLNLGKSCEDLGRMEEAKRYYDLAESAARVLPDDGLGNMIRQGIERGKRRVGA